MEFSSTFTESQGPRALYLALWIRCAINSDALRILDVQNRRSPGRLTDSDPHLASSGGGCFTGRLTPVSIEWVPDHPTYFVASLDKAILLLESQPRSFSNERESR